MKKRFLFVLPCFLLGLGSCGKPAAVAPQLTPKAFGTQIVEQSGGKQVAGVGARLNDPVVVQVNGTDGNGVPRALVTFRGDGLNLNPPQALTDDSGQASVVVQLGAIPGIYQVVAETPKPGGGGTSRVTLRQIALGYQEKVGKEISDKYCVMCHDPESTPERVSNFDNLAPPPHLFSDGNILNAISDVDLVKIIADGGPALGKSPQTPAYGNTLKPAEIKAVIAYMRAIADPPYSAQAAK